MQNNRFKVKQWILHNILQKWQILRNMLKSGRQQRIIRGKNFPIFEVKDIGYTHSKQSIDKWLDQYINSQK